jgi:transposase
MPRGKQLDVGEKAKIMAWFAEGVSTKEIANRLKRDPSTVRRIIRVVKDLPMSANPPLTKPRSGRPRITNRKLDKRLRRYLLRYPFKTAKELKAEVAGWQNVSVRTIQKVCKVRLGLPSRCAAKKPLLTAKMVKKRLSFCKKHHSWSELDWETIMFSDKSTFHPINPRAQKVRRSSLTSRYKQCYTIRNVKHLASVMVWGCFSGLGGSDRYIAMRKDKLLFWMTHHRAKHFLQDGAPCHSSRKVMAFLKENKVSVMDWPGNSLDLNPIENLWSILKAKLKKNHQMTSLPQLIQAIKQEWIPLPRSMMVKLAHSMPNRIKLCMENSGQMTKY